MTEDKTVTRLWNKYCDDQVQQNIRHGALARDWHRLRDQDAEWRLFQRIVTRVVVVIAALFVIGALTGCDTPEKLCGRWDAMVKGYEICIDDPDCHMTYSGYRKMSKARFERAKWCPEEKL